MTVAALLLGLLAAGAVCGASPSSERCCWFVASKPSDIWGNRGEGLVMPPLTIELLASRERHVMGRPGLPESAAPRVSVS